MHKHRGETKVVNNITLAGYMKRMHKIKTVTKVDNYIAQVKDTSNNNHFVRKTAKK